MHDLAVRGGVVIDGSGAGRAVADILIDGDRIAAVERPGGGTALRSIDATGLVVAPGFIDAHTHDDQLVLETRAEHPKLTQGVCTVVTGNCGVSLAPLQCEDPPAPLDILGRRAYRFASFADYTRMLDEYRPAVNVVPLVGHTTLRVRHVRDLTCPASPGEAQAMHGEVLRALEAGAFGLSTGVYYPPARAADIRELEAVSAALRGWRAVLAVHLRDEGDAIDAALREAFAVASHGEARLVLSHHKVLGPHNAGRTRDTLATIERAGAGLDVCLDCYPYAASSTMLAPEKVGQASEVIVTWSRTHPECSGMRLASIAALRGEDLQTTARRLMPGGAIYFSMSEEDVRRVLQHPLAMIGSDGLPHDRNPHPRLWGSFPRVLGHYSRALGLLSLESAVHKMTGLPARRFGLDRRGLVRTGYAADLVLFDPATVRDTATYDAPARPCTGMEYVLVNGQIAMRRGVMLRSDAGRRLRPAHPAAKGAACTSA